MANASLRVNRPGNLGVAADRERPLRSALYIRDLWHGAVVHAHCNWALHSALEAARHSAPLPLHGIPVAARDLRADRRGLDTEHDHHPSHRGVLGNVYRAARRARISILETQQPE